MLTSPPGDQYARHRRRKGIINPASGTPRYNIWMDRIDVCDGSPAQKKGGLEVFEPARGGGSDHAKRMLSTGRDKRRLPLLFAVQREIDAAVNRPDRGNS